MLLPAAQGPGVGERRCFCIADRDQVSSVAAGVLLCCELLRPAAATADLCGTERIDCKLG
jgi:hypothetical protein